MNLMDFYVSMNPPTVTAQMHRVKMVNGKPLFYDSPELSDARQKLTAYLSRYAPIQPYKQGIRLAVIWAFLPVGNHKDGDYRTTRPDTDNLQKLLKDVMTKLRFWQDDALVASETIEKIWCDKPGLYIAIEPLEE